VIETYDGSFQREKYLFVMYGDGKRKRLHHYEGGDYEERKIGEKVAIVTGASKGIGAGIALAMGREGAAVVVNYSSSEARAKKVVAEIIAAGGKAVGIQGDVSKAADVARLFAETKKAFGKPNVSGEQRGRIPARTVRRNDRGHISLAFQHERAGSCLDLAGGNQVLRRRGRKHHHHHLDRGFTRPADDRGLFVDQSSGRKPDARLGSGARWQKHSCKRHLSRNPRVIDLTFFGGFDHRDSFFQTDAGCSEEVSGGGHFHDFWHILLGQRPLVMFRCCTV
jgi:short chain dehydrogenase